jgi:integrase
MHAFRHTVGSLLVDSGAPVTVAQAQLRHSDKKTTMMYAHLLGESHRDAMQKVAGLLASNGPQTVN